jgi:hypothetical protein
MPVAVAVAVRYHAFYEDDVLYGMQALVGYVLPHWRTQNGVFVYSRRKFVHCCFSPTNPFLQPLQKQCIVVRSQGLKLPCQRKEVVSDAYACAAAARRALGPPNPWLTVI